MSGGFGPGHVFGAWQQLHPTHPASASCRASPAGMKPWGIMGAMAHLSMIYIVKY